MWHFLKGYVIIQIEGFCAGRFLKRMTEAGIRVTDIRRVGETTVRFSIPCKSFFSLRKLRKGLPLRIRIVSRGGLPFLLKKLGRRPVLWIGGALLFAGMLFLSNRIWVIRIDETKRVDPEEVLALLKEDGVYPGAFLQGPILITAANDLSAKVRDAAWIGLDREGVMLRVSIREALPESAKRTDREPSDIVAEKDGIVTYVQVLRGQARVKVGDRVKKGDVLISGTILYKDEQVETAADGIVRAAIDYRTESALFETVTESFETGRTETIRILRFWDRELLRTKPTFAHYRIAEPKASVPCALLPMHIETVTAWEIEFRERTLDTEEARQYALMRALESAYAAVPRDAEIINTYGTIRQKRGVEYAVVIVTAEEIIGKTEEIPHDR